MPDTARMPAAHGVAWILTIIFAIGLAGCAIVIPLAAWKFFSVLLEKDTPDESAREYVEFR